MKSIRRQVILLIATFVFVMSLCGAVAATDSQEGSINTETDKNNSDISKSNQINQSGKNGSHEWVLTDAEGKFSFHNISGQNHMVWVDEESLNSVYNHKLNSRLSLTLSPGNMERASERNIILNASFIDNSIQGRLFEDLNGNEIFDVSDRPLSGVKIVDPPEIHFLMLVWPTESGQLAEPIKNIMQRFPEVKIKCRSTTQAQNNISEIISLVEWADLIYISNIQTVNGNSGPLPDLLMSLKSQGKLNGKIIAAYPNPYYCFPVMRLTNFANTSFVDKNGTNLTDTQLQTMFESISRAIPPKTSMSVLKDLQSQYPAMAEYIKVREYSNPDTASPKNREEMLVYLLEKSFPSSGYTALKPVIVNKSGLYRQGQLYYNYTEYQQFLNSSRPTVGILAWMATTWERSDLIMVDRLIQEFESRGFNAMPLIAQGNPVDGSATFAGIKQFFLDSQNKTRVDGIVTLQSFKVGGDTFSATIEKIWAQNDILVFRALSLAENEQSWIVSDLGMDATSLISQVVLPEMQGQILTMVVSTTEKTIDPSTGLQLDWNIPIDERIETFADRVAAWLNLKKMANADKKVALIYYNYPPGKQNLAGASYLNGLESIMEILKTLKNENYTVNGVPQSSEQLLDVMLKQGLNVANWAPGILNNVSQYTVLWDVQEYKQWYSKLPALARKEIEEGPFGYIEALFHEVNDLKNLKLYNALKEWHDSLITTIDEMKLNSSSKAKQYVEKAYGALNNILSGKNEWSIFYNAKNSFLALNVSGLCGWGPAPGNVMTVKRNGTDYFVIPGIYMGNVFVGPQPQRGWEANADMLYHSQVVPPHHQYLAWYAYMQQEFQSDAYIHLGRHGTYEWLPGKDSALSGSDYSDICLGNVPSIYIYIMDGVGEVIHAKRRGLAVTISHITPPLNATELYGDLASLKTFIDQYNDKPDNVTMTSIKSLITKLDMVSVLGGLNQSDSQLIDKLELYIQDLESTMMPWGLHIFGKDWTPEKVMTLAKSMANVPRINKGQNVFVSPYEASKTLNIPLDQLITTFYNGTSWALFVNQTQTSLGRNLTDLEKNATLLMANDVVNIKNSPYRERTMLLRALNGGFIPATTGNDPLRNPESLPTGGNLYGLDPSKLPTAAAWVSGSKMAEDALKSYSKVPEQLAVVIWATETQNDKGATVSFVLRLMGLEPIYGFGGAINGVKATPIGNLSRPRVDVLMTTSGIFRETFSQLAILLDRGSRVALAASYNTIMASFENETIQNKTKLQKALNSAVSSIKLSGMFIPGNDSLAQNYIAKHWLEDTKYFLSKGINEEKAGLEAISRLFGPSLGNFGTRLPEAVQQSWTWDERTQLGNLYIDSMKYSYQEDNWASEQENILKQRLNDVEGVYHSRSSNLYGVVDVDHNFEFLGGLRLAVETVSGRIPGMYILNQMDPTKSKVEDLATFMSREMNARYFNPNWIRGMMENGYKGANQISENFVSNVWGWDVVAPEIISEDTYNNIVDTYLKDKYNIGVTKWLSSGKNSYAMMSITGTLLSAAHSGNWKPDKTTLKLVANTLAQMVVQNGVSCDHHVCGDVAMVEWAMQYVDADIVSKFKEHMYSATNAANFAPEPSNPSDGGNPSHGDSGDGSDGGSSPGAGSRSDSSPDMSVSEESQTPMGEQSNQKSYEVSKANNASSTSSNIPLYAIVGLIALMGLIGFGYFKGVGRN